MWDLHITSLKDKNIWLSVIEMLKKKDKLPMVAFIFSKRRIEDNIFNLQSVDLTTAAEKAEIHIFFRKCISRLKGEDSKIPQVRSLGFNGVQIKRFWAEQMKSKYLEYR